jgi:tripartite-type tricarboxylate transporter receptor subunit TctC
MQVKVLNGKELWNAKGSKRIQECKLAGRGRATRRALMVAGAIVGAALFIGTMAQPICAQTYPDPSKPIRFILGMPPGGGVDMMGRLLGTKLGEQMKQTVVHENRTGANGFIGYDYTSKASPDGYTIVLATPGITIAPNLIKEHSRFDPTRNLSSIALVGQSHQMLLVRPTLPVKNVKELVDYARANPGKLNFGSSGIGSTPHLGGELFNSLAKIKITHVPYKGAGPALTGLMVGEIDVAILGLPTCIELINAGKVRALAALSKSRPLLLPDMPTANESGVKGFEVPIWYGVMAPPGTPRNIINRLNTEFNKVTARPDVREAMGKAFFEPLSSTPEELTKFLKDEMALWNRLIKEAKIPII